jgi:hypothetical protein
MFLTELDLRTTTPGKARLLAPLLWRDALFGEVEFPAGTVTDLGSVPQTLRRFKAFDPWHTGRKSAVGHDALYRLGKWPDGRPCARADADEFLRVAMVAEGYSAATARSWWLGVRSCGWLPWRRYRKAEADGHPILD